MMNEVSRRKMEFNSLYRLDLKLASVMEYLRTNYEIPFMAGEPAGEHIAHCVVARLRLLAETLSVNDSMAVGVLLVAAEEPIADTIGTWLDDQSDDVAHTLAFDMICELEKDGSHQFSEDDARRAERAVVDSLRQYGLLKTPVFKTDEPVVVA